MHFKIVTDRILTLVIYLFKIVLTRILFFSLEVLMHYCSSTNKMNTVMNIRRRPNILLVVSVCNASICKSHMSSMHVLSILARCSSINLHMISFCVQVLCYQQVVTTFYLKS